MTAAGDLAQVTAFRNALVEYVNFVMEHGGSRFDPPSVSIQRQIGEAQVPLAREYGRLYTTIFRVAGISTMGSPMLGTVSQDVVHDAINRPDLPGYGDAARIAVSHLDTAIGRLQARAERERPWADPQRIYRATSPVFWIVRTAAAVVRMARWVMATARRRLAAAIGAVVLVVVGAIVSGWASAFFAKLLGP